MNEQMVLGLVGIFFGTIFIAQIKAIKGNKEQVDAKKIKKVAVKKRTVKKPTTPKECHSRACEIIKELDTILDTVSETGTREARKIESSIYEKIESL